MVSFVIPAHNEEALIGATVDAIHAAAAAVLAPAPYEIVVADDASTDSTGAIAAAKGARVVSVAHRQISRTRNSGARAAVGDPLFFIDADTRLTPQVLREAVAALNAGAVGGCALIRLDGWVPRYARVLLALLVGLFRLLRLGGGCCVFCTREAFNAAGGWDDSLFAGEEIYFIMAIKRRFGRRRFVIVNDRVVTSGRKLRGHPAREVIGTLVRLTIRGPRGVRSRAGLELWYGPRRPDPLARSRPPAGE